MRYDPYTGAGQHDILSLVDPRADIAFGCKQCSERDCASKSKVAVPIGYVLHGRVDRVTVAG